MIALEELDKRILNILQSRFPLVPRPFDAVAEELGVSPEEILTRVRRLKEDRVIRQISAIFDSKSLGYKSTLVAMAVPAVKLDEVAATLNANTGVTHNYARTHRYNLWFTLTVPPEKDLEATVMELAGSVGIGDVLILPTTRLFKIGVQFDLLEGTSASHKAISKTRIKSSGPVDSRIVRELQKDLLIERDPFAKSAESLGLTPETLLSEAQTLEEQGVMRRFAAVLRHREAGFAANGMGVWVVPAERIEEVGTISAGFPQVSHCYQRPSYPDWPYTLFTMIHGRSEEECDSVAREISAKTGITDYILLFSTKEYKKVRAKYFEGEPD